MGSPNAESFSGESHSSSLSSSSSNTSVPPPMTGDIHGAAQRLEQPNAGVNNSAQEAAQKQFRAEDVAHTQSGTLWARRIVLAPIGLPIWAVASLAKGAGLIVRRGAGLIASAAETISKPAVTAYKVYKTKKKLKAENAINKEPKSTNNTLGKRPKLTVTGETVAFTESLALLDRYIKGIPFIVNPPPGQQLQAEPGRLLQPKPGELLSENNLPEPSIPLKRDIATSRSEYGEKAQALVTAFHHCLKKSEARSDDCETKVQECLERVNEQIMAIAATPSSKERDKALKKIETLLKECALKVAGVSEKTFKKEYDIARGICTPPNLVNNITPNTREITRRHKHTFSMQYLQERDPEKFEAQIEFMESHEDFLRVSELKNSKEMRGVAMNAHEHVLVAEKEVNGEEITVDKLDENGNIIGKCQVVKKKNEDQEVRSTFRSGAFAVHGRHEERIDILKEKIKELEQKEIQWEIRKNRPPETAYHPANCQKIINETRQEIEHCKEQILGIKKAKNMGILSLEGQLEKFKIEETRINGMSEGDDKTKAIARLNKKLRKELGFKDMEEFRAEISMRRDFCISQALPELLASIMKSAENPEALRIALAAGSFLHVVESLLSHLDGAERAMIEDMKGALDYLSKNVTIKFVENQPGAEISVNNDDINNPKITISLPMPQLQTPIPEYQNGFPKDVELGLTAICFNTAVNEAHTLRQLGGVFVPGKYLTVEKLQDQILAEGLNRLQAYQADAAQRLNSTLSTQITPRFRDISNHYSEIGSRDTKDMKGMKLREDFVKFLGGQLSVKCKSGKDRTGAKICQYFSDEFSSKTPKERANKQKIKERLQLGISYHLTGINTGKCKGFAFNEVQQRCLPEALALPENVCGSAPS